MAEAGTNNEALLSNPVPSPLIDRDEPAEAKAKPAPAADDKKADIPAATDDNAKPPEDETHKQSRRQRKLQVERDARIRAETRAEMAERALADARKPAAEAKGASEPKREDFQDYESFLDAKNDWRTKQGVEAGLKADREERSKREQEGKTRAGQEALAKDWTQREAEFQKKVPTYVDDVTDFVEGELQQLSDQARHAIVELGPEILHHLSTNDELMDELLRLSPLRQVARLGRIDLTAKDAGAEASNAEAEVDEEPAPKRREPPAPAKHVRHGVTTPAALSDDMDVYVQQRKKQGARWAR